MAKELLFPISSLFNNKNWITVWGEKNLNKQTGPHCGYPYLWTSRAALPFLLPMHQCTDICCVVRGVYLGFVYISAVLTEGFLCFLHYFIHSPKKKVQLTPKGSWIQYLKFTTQIRSLGRCQYSVYTTHRSIQLSKKGGNGFNNRNKPKCSFLTAQQLQAVKTT